MDAVLNGAPVSVTASQTGGQKISNYVRVRNRYDALWVIDLSAISITNGITFKLRDSADATESFQDVGDQSEQAAVKKSPAGGTREVTDVTLPAFADATQADYLHVTAQDGTTFAVWLDKDANGTAPTGALYLAADEQIRVIIATGDTAAQVATKVRADVVANAAWAAAFTTGTVSTATFTITQVLGGAVADPAPKSENDGGAGSITVSVTTAGSNGDLNLSTEAITITTHGWITGQRVIYRAGTSAIGGLTDGTVYWVIKVDANTIKLATSCENAYAGTAIDLTSYGVGTQAIYQARYEIRMIKEDSSDLAQLPLHEYVQAFATSGASDSCTVSHVYVPET